MERDYLEWINKSYGSFIKNKELKSWRLMFRMEKYLFTELKML